MGTSASEQIVNTTIKLQYGHRGVVRSENKKLVAEHSYAALTSRKLHTTEDTSPWHEIDAAGYGTG